MKVLERVNLDFVKHFDFRVLQVFLWPILLLVIPVSYELGGLSSTHGGAEWEGVNDLWGFFVWAFLKQFLRALEDSPHL